jgi:hypothetical protein
MRERIGFGGVGVPPAALRLVEFKSRRQDAGATQVLRGLLKPFQEAAQDRC